jgi:general stress protein 26
MIDKILEILNNKQFKLCALATATKSGKPDNAIMGYAVMDDLTIILSTHKKTKKWQYLNENRNVSLVFGWSFEDAYIQYEGTADLVEDGEVYKQCDTFFFSMNPMALKFKTPDTVFIKIHPSWIRLSDFRINPPLIEETDFS